MHADPQRQTIDRTVLDRYLAGESDAGERAAVGAWLTANPEQAARLAHSVAMSPERVQADWARIVARIGDAASDASGLTRRSGRGRGLSTGRLDARPRWRWSAALVMAAAAALLVIVGRMGLFTLPSSSRPTVTTYTTTAGERANIILPDGSHVALNVASQLQVPTDFMQGDRRLRLTGEALFTVAHHTTAPFMVLSGGTETRVLGTSFLVRHYAADTATVVAVRDGKVAVRSTVLTAGRQMTIGRVGHAPVQPADADQFAFAAGVLVLRYMPLSQAIPELNRWYDADVRLGDPSLATHGIRGRFLAGSSADLAAVLAFDVRVVRDGRVLTLYPR